MKDPRALLAALPLGTRVVIRYRIAEGSTDALGHLLRRDEDSVTVAARAGELTIKLDDVRLAKPVPPPPPRRERR